MMLSLIYPEVLLVFLCFSAAVYESRLDRNPPSLLVEPAYLPILAWCWSNTRELDIHTPRIHLVIACLIVIRVPYFFRYLLRNLF